MYEQTTAWIDTVNPVVVAIIFILVAFVHFLPTIIAFSRNHPNQLAILILNFLLGWTGLVWIVLMVWALRGGRSDGIVSN